MQVILTQTDTTVGFISQSSQKLSEIKSRPLNKEFLKVYSSFKLFLSNSNRVPSSKKNLLRRSKKTSFVVKNRAFRVSHPLIHSQLLRDANWNYSTSANKSGENFERKFCEEKADIIIENFYKLSEHKSSQILKINNKKIRKLR